VGSLQLPLLEAAPIALRAACPLIATYHCDVTLPPGLSNTVQQRVVDASNRAAMRAAAAVSVTSEDYGRHSRMWPSIEPSMVVVPPPCREVPPGAPTYRETAGPHIGFLGRIVREKGLQYLVRGFRALPDPDARLLIGGDYTTVAGGSVVEEVRAAIGDDSRVRLLGFVPDELLGDFYASLDVFTLPSVNAFEAFGIVQAVAMLAGVPVLSSDIPGVRQPVAQTGFGTLVPPADPAAITAALTGLVTSPPDRTAGALAAHRAFSVDGVLDTYEALMDKVADDHS
jgi:glycosyltransferase involved in cell wall biosynthesis